MINTEITEITEKTFSGFLRDLCVLCVETRLMFSVASVFRRTFGVIDDQNVERLLVGLQPQAQLFTHSRED